MSSIYCELPEFFVWSEPVARKPHQCCECNAPILSGEKHFSCRGSWNGKFACYRQHLVCMEACMMIRDNFGGDCIGFGTLKDEFNEIRADNWYPEKDRFKPAWQQLRHLMAVIFWRERSQRR